VTDGRDDGLVCGVSSSDVQSKKCLPQGRATVSLGPRYALRAVGGIEQVLDPGRYFPRSGISIVFRRLPPPLPLPLYYHITRGNFFHYFLSFPHAQKSFSDSLAVDCNA
jgi:hypothetical protein